MGPEEPIDIEDELFVNTHDEVPLWSARFGLLLLDHLDLSRGLSVLDVGTGTGFLALELGQTLGPDSEVIGIDIWKQALARADSKRAARRVNNVVFREADAVQLPFSDGQFDLVVSNLGINNFDNPALAVAECCRVLRPGGRLAVTTNLHGHMREFYAVFRGVLRELRRPDYIERLNANEAHRGSRESVRALIESAAFRVRREVEGSFALSFANGTALLHHHLVRIGFLDGWRRCVDESDEQPVFERLEARLNEVAERTGYLATSVPTLFVEAVKVGP